MEVLILFVVVFLILWGASEGLGILYRQYKAETPDDIDSRGEWGLPGVGKVYPSARLGCGVCGVWTPKATCSECVTWAEIQSIDGEKHNALVRSNELVRRRKAAGW